MVRRYIEMNEEEIEEFKGHITYLDKLSPYKLKYRCTDDCVQWGCPGHIATFEIHHTTDTFSIDWGTGKDDKVYFDGVRMAMINDFMNRFKRL